jgi:protein subunit release factor B
MSYQPVSKKKWELLRQKMQQLDLKENGLVEKFILSGGRGGQKVNKTSVCVYLRHKPSGIEVKCSDSRYRELNRFLARRRLCEKVESAGSPYSKSYFKSQK